MQQRYNEAPALDYFYAQSTRSAQASNGTGQKVGNRSSSYVSRQAGTLSSKRAVQKWYFCTGYLLRSFLTLVTRQCCVKRCCVCRFSVLLPSLCLNSRFGALILLRYESATAARRRRWFHLVQNTHNTNGTQPTRRVLVVSLIHDVLNLSLLPFATLSFPYLYSSIPLCCFISSTALF